MADGIRQTIMALSTVVDLYIEGKVISTEFLVLPDAKGNKTLPNRQENPYTPDRNEACFQPGESTPFIEHRFDTSDQPPIATYPYRMNPARNQDCQKENPCRRRRKIYKPGDKVWGTIHPINRNNKNREIYAQERRSLPHTHLEITSNLPYENNPDPSP
ncbi:hypothetical protein TNCV_3743691 [Trichonephila clavipes]|nr:hypothetical protein TNCV_3743691 [Trichonephila clavipes]